MQVLHWTLLWQVAKTRAFHRFAHCAHMTRARGCRQPDLSLKQTPSMPLDSVISITTTVHQMRVDLPSTRTMSVAGTPPTLRAQWSVGTVLQAVSVVDAAGKLWLDIGTTRYAARLASSEMDVPRNGERLQLRVLRDSPVLALETLKQPQAEEQADPTLEALRRYVPRQNSPAPLAANLVWMVSNGPRSNLPPAVLQSAALLFRAMPEADALGNAQQLQQAVTDSGAFLEAKLAGAPTPAASQSIANDLKALLLQFSQVLKDQGARANSAPLTNAAAAPPATANGALQALPASAPSLATLEQPGQQLHELARQTDGAVARLTALQITNSAPDPLAPALLVELPIRHDDQVSMLRLRIERDQSRQGEAAESAWTVEAALDLGAAGGLHARVHLQGQRLDVQLRAASADVVSALTQRRGELEAILREAGLDVQRVVCLHGLPVADPDIRAARLLDLRA